MGLRFRPGFNIGKNIRVGKTGISFRTGIPGLTYRANFSKTASGSSYSEEGQPIVLPSIGRAIFNIIALIGLVFVLVAFVGMIWEPLAFVIPFLFIGRAYRPLTQNHTYGWKEEAVYRRDRRYKAGQRHTGYQSVIDKDNPIPYTPEQRMIARVEGSTKVFFLGLVLMWLVLVSTKVKPVPNAPLSIKNLTVGSPLSAIKRQEKRKLESIGDWYYVDETKYANEVGKIDFHTQNEVVKEIEFTPADTSAYPRLAKLLYAKYGAAQDTTTFGLTWKNDSLNLELSNYAGPVLKLHRSGFLE